MTVYFIGAGPGAPDLITVRGLRLIESCPVCLYAGSLVPEEIVDTYVSLGFAEIFLRPLSRHGFARRNARSLGYSVDEFHSFYERAFERILHWNRRNSPIREVAASIALNKMLCPFDATTLQVVNRSGVSSIRTPSDWNARMVFKQSSPRQ